MDKVVLNLMDDVSSWKPGDRIVVASTDYSMHQAEEFTLLPCPHCNRKQVRIQGEVNSLHFLWFLVVMQCICPESWCVFVHSRVQVMTVSLSLRQEKGEDCKLNHINKLSFLTRGQQRLYR